MNKKEHKAVLAEFDAMISQARGETKGFSIKHDPALARNLEWLEHSYLELIAENKSLKEKRVIRKDGEHLFVPAGGLPLCATCGRDEDDAFVGGEKCTFRKLKRFPKSVVIAYARKMNTPAAARRLMEVDEGGYIVSKP
jgi:hypothetical protein